MRKILAGILVSSGLALATSVAFAGDDHHDGTDRTVVRPLVQAQMQTSKRTVIEPAADSNSATEMSGPESDRPTGILHEKDHDGGGR